MALNTPPRTSSSSDRTPRAPLPRVLLFRSLGSSLPTLLSPIAQVDATHDVPTFAAKLEAEQYDFVVAEVHSAADVSGLRELLARAPGRAKVVLYSYADPQDLDVGQLGEISVLHGVNVPSRLLHLIQGGDVPAKARGTESR